MGKKYLGIEIGGTKLQFLVADENLNIIRKYNDWFAKRLG
jgi:predicted NBD/HSP70 family sugar kinase